MDKNTPILLVDDEEGIRKVLGIALADMGYQTHTAKNGEEALEIFKKIRPPIILTDIKMPGMDGIELLQRIKPQAPDTEIIMITGHGDLDLAIKSLKYEASDFITKPISEEALEVALKRSHDRIAIRKQLKAYTESLEKLVQEKTKKLVEAQRLATIGQTVAGLSHAIKNIASGLKGGSFVLEKGIELEDKTYLHQGWEMVHGNVEKIARLSMDLLNFAKSSKITYLRCNPNQPAKEVAELMSSEASRSKINLLTEFDARLAPFYFDPDGIHRCLLNLVANAIDACRDDASHNNDMKVVLRTIKTAGWGVEYQVEDNGCGMDSSTLKKLFQYFFSTKGTEGTGIGLMMTKNIVEKHKGEIDVQSQVGSGSTFIIRLPKLDQPENSPDDSSD